MANEKALNNAYLLSIDEEFRGRVKAATVRVALQVISEPNPSTAFRKSYAQSFLRAPSSYVNTIVEILSAWPQVSQLGSTSNSVPDDAILAGVAAIWDYVSQFP